MITLLLALMFLGPLLLIAAPVIWALARRKRQGDWRWPAWGALALALFMAMGTVGGLAFVRSCASADAASRATMLARGISETMNFAAFSIVLVCLVTCAYYGYRFFIAKPPL